MTYKIGNSPIKNYAKIRTHKMPKYPLHALAVAQGFYVSTKDISEFTAIAYIKKWGKRNNAVYNLKPTPDGKLIYFWRIE